MKAEIKSLCSLELEDSLTQYQPKDTSNFGTWIRARIGPENASGSDSFDILVCTADWLRTRCAEYGPVWGRHMLVIAAYDFGVIESFVARYVAQCTGIDWPSVAIKLSRNAAWEFEDYQT
jgi:hypothetical protein